MMTLSQNTPETFQSALDLAFQQSAGDPLLKKIRQKAWDRFLELGLPTTKNDVYRYIPLRKLFAQAYEHPQSSHTVTFEQIKSHILPECAHSLMVFVNGHYAPELSNLSALPSKAVVTPLAEALRSFGAFLTNKWNKSLTEETDAFAALNAALHPSGIFFYLPPRTLMEKPLQVLEVIDSQNSPLMVMPRMHFFVGNQSELKVVSTLAPLSGVNYWINQTADFSIEEQAHVEYTQLSYHLPEAAWHLAATRASLKRDSTFIAIHATEGSTTTRHDYRLTLTGENANAELNGAWVLNGKREAHTHVLIEHQSPNCRSLQLFKGILNEASHSSFEGKILVRQAAQKTNAFQLNNNLLLSDAARAESKPNLEIFADDVKASHGATIGQLDNEELFYLTTRGCTPSDAKRLLVDGFVKDVFDKVTIPSCRASLAQHMQHYL